MFQIVSRLMFISCHSLCGRYGFLLLAIGSFIRTNNIIVISILNYDWIWKPSL